MAAASQPPIQNQQNLLVPALVLILVALSFGIGVLWQKVETLEKGGTTAGVQAQPSQQAAQPNEPPKASLEQIKELFNKDIIKFGDSNKKLLFVEVADPSCPYCHVAAGKNPELSKQMGPQFTLVSDGGTYAPPVEEMKKLVDSGQASFAWIYTNGHGSGEMGTKALYCAFEKSKFWQAHDLLMSNDGYNLLNNTIKNDKTKAGDLAAFLKPAVDASFMESCLTSGKYDQRISSDSQLAGSIGISGTPGFYVNDQRFSGAYSFTDMKSAIDSSL